MANPIVNAQNNNKCPHGMPQGTCPICSGMGGGSRPKDRNKPRVAGEMSYNECMAVWIRMQKAKQAKIQDKLDKLENIKNIDFKKQLEREFLKIQDKINSYFEKLDKTVQKLPPVIKTITSNAIKIIHKVLNIVVNIAFNISNFVVSVSEKMAMVLSEIKNHISSFIQKTIEKTKKVIKTILSLFMEFDENSEESDKQKIEEVVKEAIKKFMKKDKEKENELV